MRSGVLQRRSDRTWQRDANLPVDRLVQHYPHTAINDAVADMLAGKTIKAVLRLDPAPAGQI